MSRSIGPLPLSDGLYLRAPEAKPGALLRAMNIESRGGMLRTRRGSSAMGRCAVRDGVFALGSSSPALNGVLQAPTAGANEVIGTFTTQPLPGELVEVLFLGTNNNVPADILVQYYADGGVWKTMETVDYFGQRGAIFREGYTPFSGANTFVPAGRESHHFVVPEDWTTQTFDVLLGAGWNIRIKLSAPMGGPAVAGLPELRRFRSSFMPRLSYVQSRRRSRAYIMGTDSSGHTNIFKSDLQSDLKECVPFTSLSTASADGDMLYIPATNEMLFTDGNTAIIVDADPADEIAVVPTPFDPATASTVPPALPEYLDIPLENALPGFTAMGLYAGRVFIGGFVDEPTKIRWSAPDEAWHAFPSDNVAILGAGASGRIVAFSVFNETLFVFTTRGIWSGRMEDGSGDSESLLFLQPLESTGCPSDRGIVSCDKGIFFMSEDGPRVITTNAPSKPLLPQIQDLFRNDALYPQACTRKATVCAAWDRVEQRVLFAYASPGNFSGDTVLVLDMKDKTAWLWGSDVVADLNARLNLSTAGAGATVQRPRGLRITSMEWNPEASQVMAVSSDGLVFHLTGPDDMGIRMPWFFETETLRLAAGSQGVVERVELLVSREHFSNIDVAVVPDGDVSRINTRTVRAEPDRVDTTSVLGGASLAGQGLAPLEDSFAPLRWRGRTKCRNFRVRVSSNSGAGHAPTAVVACTVDVSVDDGKR